MHYPTVRHVEAAKIILPFQLLHCQLIIAVDLKVKS